MPRGRQRAGGLLAGLCALALTARPARADDVLVCQPDGGCVVLVPDAAAKVTLRIDPAVAARAPAVIAGGAPAPVAKPCKDDATQRCIVVAAPAGVQSWRVAVDGHVITVRRSSLAEALGDRAAAELGTSFSTETIDLAELTTQYERLGPKLTVATSSLGFTKAFGPGHQPPAPPTIPALPVFVGMVGGGILVPSPGPALPLAVQVPGVGAPSRAGSPPPLGPAVGPGAPVPPAPPPGLGAADPDRFLLDVVGVGGADRYHCSGVVIAPRLVLTARHCVPATRVAIGSDLGRPLATIAITEAIAHPTLDAALLRLAGPAPVPARPRRGGADRREPRSQVRLIGFGVDDFVRGAGFGTKRAVGVVARGWGCDRARARATGCDPAAELVLPTDGGRDTCEGDSGGAVLEPFGATWRLVAITSRPLRSAGPGCGRGGIYVRVDALDAWIREQPEESRR